MTVRQLIVLLQAVKNQSSEVIVLDPFAKPGEQDFYLDSDEPLRIGMTSVMLQLGERAEYETWRR
jgi:hypothetical protein